MSDDDDFHAARLPSSSPTCGLNTADDDIGVTVRSKNSDEKTQMNPANATESSGTSLTSTSFHSESSESLCSCKERRSIEASSPEESTGKSSQRATPVCARQTKLAGPSNQTADGFLNDGLLPSEADSDSEDWANFPGEIEDEADCEVVAGNESAETDRQPVGQRVEGEASYSSNPTMGNNELQESSTEQPAEHAVSTDEVSDNNKYSSDTKADDCDCKIDASKDDAARDTVDAPAEENDEAAQEDDGETRLIATVTEAVDTVDEIVADLNENAEKFEPEIASTDFRISGHEDLVEETKRSFHSSVETSSEDFEPESERDEDKELEKIDDVFNGPHGAGKAENGHTEAAAKEVAEELTEAAKEDGDDRELSVATKLANNEFVASQNDNSTSNDPSTTAEAVSVPNEMLENTSNEENFDAEPAKVRDATEAQEGEQEGASPIRRQRREQRQHRSRTASSSPDSRDRQLREARQAYERSAAEMRQAWQGYVTRLRELRREDADAANGSARHRAAREVEEHWLSPAESDTAAEVRVWLLNKKRAERQKHQRDGEQRCREQRERLNAEAVLSERRRAAQVAYQGWLRRKQRQAAALPASPSSDADANAEPDPHSQLFDLLSARCGTQSRSAASTPSKRHQPVHNSVFPRPMSSIAAMRRRRTVHAAGAPGESPRIVLAGRRIDVSPGGGSSKPKQQWTAWQPQRHRPPTKSQQPPKRRAPRTYSANVDEAASSEAASPQPWLSVQATALSTAEFRY